MTVIVPRTCTEISTRDVDRNGEKTSQSLAEFRSTSAYVLLGDPGSGKTTAFDTECKELGENACLITARDFLAFAVNSHPEWRKKTLFIDGLDEIRAGLASAPTPFDQIRGRLDELGRPHFRLSCRDAEWLGENDRSHLVSVSPDSQVKVLRLDLLKDSDVIRVLDDVGIADAQAFIAEAHERGVVGLLVNPQSLKMLADVVARGGGWPESRMGTFEKACSQIVRKQNEENRLGSQPPTPADQVLDAAGRLCAVQLFSGNAGYTLVVQGNPDDDYPDLDTCGYDRHEVLKAALASRLFIGGTNSRFSPVHRHIAEFLGARHLTRLINEGLPARRILALMTGEDGAVVTEMRGMSAWLAAHCRNVRADLIERDPIGVALYGDLREFSHDEKHALLKNLKREGARLGPVFRAAAAFGALATPDMESVFKELLANSCRDHDHQMLTELVLRLLGHGAALPGLSEIVLEIVRDDTWWPRINTQALDAFIHIDNDQEDKTSKLTELLAYIQSGRVSDPDNELLGTLLAQLYPDELPPSEVWNYLSETGNPELIGRHHVFWDTGLIKKTTTGDVAVLLDSMAERLPFLQPALDVRHLSGLPLKLLAVGLEIHGDEIETGRLYDWLSVGSSRIRDTKASWYGDEAIHHIRSWLGKRPEIQKKLIVEGLDRCPETEEFRGHAFDVQERLYGADLPADLGLWCLEQAAAIVDTKSRIAEHLLEVAFLAHAQRSGDKGLSLELLQEHTRKNELLKTSLARLLSPRSIPPGYSEETRKDSEYIEERGRQKKLWLDHVRDNETALRENQATPALLHQMAQAYFGRFYNFNVDDGPKAIEKLLLGDHGLIDAALQGLRGAIDRKDVPDIDEILSLRENNRMHYFGWPFLAGLAEIERTAPEDPSRWDDGRIRKAIAFYYCTPHADYRPNWYRRLLEVRPEVVADVQVRFAVSEFRSDRDGIYKLWELAHDPEHAQVARHASLPLLRGFPPRCKLKQIGALDHLLWAAIQHADRALLQDLIKRKLSRTSLNVAQRVHWFAAGVIVSPGAYDDLLKDFVSGRESRLRHLPVLFCPEDRVRFSFNELEIPLLELLIRLVGGYVGPDQWLADGWVTPLMRASGLVRELIQYLAASPNQLACAALGTLHADPALSRWRDVLSQAQDAQRVIRRDASYRHPNIKQVCGTLNGGTPANVADLAALVRDRLCEIAVQIRTGNTEDWRQYWNEKPWTPKHENSCRDALLLDMRKLLPQGIDAQPEGQYANDKRADIRVSYRDFELPVEVKKHSHRDLWRALRDQLIKQYTNAPATGGCGIYLVFWFSKNGTQPPPSGTRPDSPQKLQEQLQSTLSEDEARKISVCVIDVSRDSKKSDGYK